MVSLLPYLSYENPSLLSLSDLELDISRHNFLVTISSYRMLKEK